MTMSNICTAQPDERYLIRRTIESLRFGLVPERHIEELTLGYDELENWTKKGLKKCEAGNPTWFEVNGPYGTGKSHTLALIRHLARKQGFLTAWAVFDDTGVVSFDNPTAFLNNLWMTLTENDVDSQNPLLSVYLKALEKGRFLAALTSEISEKILNTLISIEELNNKGLTEKYSQMLEDILTSGEEYSTADLKKAVFTEKDIDKSLIRFENMISRKIDGRAGDFIDSMAGHASLARLAGYKGLIITIDENDVQSNLTNTAKSRRDTLLTLFKQYFESTNHPKKSPLGVYIATVDAHGMYGDVEISSNLESNKGNFIYLKTWEAKDRMVLAKKIFTKYREDYEIDDDFDENFARNVEQLLAQKIQNNDSGLIRSFIKWYIGLLDIKYGPPHH